VASGRDLRGTPDEVHVRTAGSRPSDQIDPTVVEVLDEIGVPVVAEFTKTLIDEVVRAADYVITMGCGDACPICPGRRHMDWPVADPIGQPLEEVRRIRGDITARLKTLCHEIDITLA
jgi:arsenate reductase